ncbi:MAG: Holliday junction resolvase RuvX [Planctomycetota bacterium]
MKAWVGVDPGEKRIGVARSDLMGMIAQPHSIVATPAELVTLLTGWSDEVHGVIVGLPRNMDGSYGPLARRSKVFVDDLRLKVPFPVYLWDERLTTQQAKRMGGRGDRVDDRAAAILLQSYLDAGTPPMDDPAELGESPEK